MIEWLGINWYATPAHVEEVIAGLKAADYANNGELLSDSPPWGQCTADHWAAVLAFEIVDRLQDRVTSEKFEQLHYCVCSQEQFDRLVNIAAIRCAIINVENFVFPIDERLVEQLVDSILETERND
jgi:hypothetical protein